MMLVSDLNDAEDIVSKNPNLSWDGWNIVCLLQDDYAEFLSIGWFDTSTKSWYKKTIYPCTEDGWHLPELLM